MRYLVSFRSFGRKSRVLEFSTIENPHKKAFDVVVFFFSTSLKRLCYQLFGTNEIIPISAKQKKPILQGTVRVSAMIGFHFCRVTLLRLRQRTLPERMPMYGSHPLHRYHVWKFRPADGMHRSPQVLWPAVHGSPSDGSP